MCARRSSQQARSGASSLRFRRRLIEATRGSGAGRRGPPRGMGGRAFERRARIAWRRADFGAARSAPAGLAAAPGPPLWTVCPSGLRGWTQVPLAQAAWVQIPQLSCSYKAFRKCLLVCFFLYQALRRLLEIFWRALRSFLVSSQALLQGLREAFKWVLQGLCKVFLLQVFTRPSGRVLRWF